jgi:hypothetical protein
MKSVHRLSVCEYYFPADEKDPVFLIAHALLPQITHLTIPDSYTKKLLERVNPAIVEYLEVNAVETTVSPDESEPGSSLDVTSSFPFIAAKGPFKQLTTLVYRGWKVPVLPLHIVFSKNPMNFPALECMKIPVPRGGKTVLPGQSQEPTCAEYLQALSDVAQIAPLKRLILASMHLFGDPSSPTMWLQLPQLLQEKLKLDIRSVHNDYESRSIWHDMPQKFAYEHPDAYNVIFEACHKTETEWFCAVSDRIDHGAIDTNATFWMVEKLLPLWKKATSANLTEGDPESESWFQSAITAMFQLLSRANSLKEHPWSALLFEFDRLVTELGLSKLLRLATRDEVPSYGRFDNIARVISRRSDAWWKENGAADAILDNPQKDALLATSTSRILDKIQQSPRFLQTIVVDSPEAAQMVTPKLHDLVSMWGKKDAQSDEILLEIQRFVSSSLIPTHVKYEAAQIIPFWFEHDERARSIGSFFSDFHLLYFSNWIWKHMVSLPEGPRRFKLALTAHSARFNRRWTNADEDQFMDKLWMVCLFDPPRGAATSIKAGLEKVLQVSPRIPPNAMEIIQTDSNVFIEDISRFRRTLVKLLSATPDTPQTSIIRNLFEEKTRYND